MADSSCASKKTETSCTIAKCFVKQNSWITTQVEHVQSQVRMTRSQKCLEILYNFILKCTLSWKNNLIISNKWIKTTLTKPQTLMQAMAPSKTRWRSRILRPARSRHSQKFTATWQGDQTWRAVWIKAFAVVKRQYSLWHQTTLFNCRKYFLQRLFSACSLSSPTKSNTWCCLKVECTRLSKGIFSETPWVKISSGLSASKMNRTKS